MKIKKFLALSLALVLVLGSFCQTAFADTWYLENGSVSVEAGESGQYVYQGGGEGVQDSAPVITQQNSSVSTTNTITLVSTGDAVVNVTVEDVNILTDGASAIDLVGDSSAVVNVEGTVALGTAAVDENASAVIHVGGGDLTLQGSGELDIYSETQGAKIGSHEDEDMSGSIHITGSIDIHTEDDGSTDGAGIGSGEYGDFTGSVTIDGDANVEAYSNDRGAGIGSGEGGDFRGSVTIGGNAVVDAEGDDDSAGIGSGEDGSFSGGSITIGGNAEVEAEGSYEGPGIGAADDTPMNGTITIKDNALVRLDPGDECDADMGAEGENAGTGSINILGNASIEDEYGDPLVIGGEYSDSTLTVNIDETVTFNGYTYSQILNGEAPEGILTVNGEPGLVHETEPVSYFRVLDANGADIPYAQRIEDGVMTVSLDVSFAELRGNRQAILLLMGANVSALRFETEEAVSSFEFTELAENGTPDSIVSLVHDGAAAALFYDGVENTGVLD